MRDPALFVGMLALWITGTACAQEVQLPSDAEYVGALLRSDAPFKVNFYPSGRVQSGYLRSDYNRDGVIFQADNLIKFYEDGSIEQGRLKAPTSISDVNFQAGPIRFRPNGRAWSGTVRAGTVFDNLTIPVDSVVELNEAGRVALVIPNASPPAMRVLNRTIRGDFTVRYDESERRYMLLQGTAGAAQLVARIAIRWDTLGQPVEIVPVIVPAGATFSLAYPVPGQIDSPPESSWVVPTPGAFILNGMNFGAGPRLRVRDMRLRAVQVMQAVTISGVQYRAQQVVTFDDAGRLVPPVSGP